jgi:predicted phosphodiesterase
VRQFRDRGRGADVIFATGDVAYAGQANEYEAATGFFDDLIMAAGVERRNLFVVPGNHDVNRKMAAGLARTFSSREQADDYFNPEIPKVHITQKQQAFVDWYDHYFSGLRSFPVNSSCGPVETIDIRGVRIGVLPINSALFCQDDDDHDKLWIGRRCLGPALEELEQTGANLKVALMHHPLDWISSFERANIKADLQYAVDFILRGHLHETDIESVAGMGGEALHLAAGAAYQTRRWPNRAIYATIDAGSVTVFPIRFEDNPQEVWTVDPSIFPWEPGFEKTFAIKRRSDRTPPTLPIIGQESFLAESGIRDLVSNSGQLSGTERVKGALLIFDTVAQRTWLVATTRQLLCIKDDSVTRTTGKMIQWHLANVAAMPIVARDHEDTDKKRTGRLDIGSRTRWLYSKKLFATSAKLEGAISELMKK